MKTTEDEVPDIRELEYEGLLYYYGEWIKNNRTEQIESSYTCAPNYEHKTKIYKIAVDVVIGFFLPYIAIAISYSGIAYMINKRARSRMNTDRSLFNSNVSTMKHSDTKETTLSPIVKYNKSSAPKLKLSPVNRMVDRKRRPVSNASASSTESFLTDQTCVQVSPGIKITPPNFTCLSRSKEIVTKTEEKNSDRTKNKSMSLVLSIEA